MKTIGKIGFGALALVCASAAKAQGPNVLHPEGVYTQAPTGMSYPVSVGDFERVSIIRYAPDGTDESAGYNRREPLHEIVATVYVFPSPSLRSFGSPRSVIAGARDHLCTEQFQGIEKEVTTAHPDAALIQDGPTSLIQASATHGGYLASYKLTNRRFAGRDNVVSRSDAYVFCFAGGKWTVEYRFDYPFDYDASGAIAGFMRDLSWTIPPEPAN